MIGKMDIYHHVRETDKTILILFISGNIEFLESIWNSVNGPAMNYRISMILKSMTLVWVGPVIKRSESRSKKA